MLKYAPLTIGVFTSACLILFWTGGMRAGDDEQIPDITGRYSYTGTNPDGSTYVGEWTIEIRHTGDTYELTWSKPGSESTRGIGIFQDEKLVVGYDQAEGIPGVIIYSVGRATRSRAGVRYELDGVWSAVGLEQIGTETLTPIR